MKWIIYFCSWVSIASDNELVNQSGVIAANDSIARVYIYPHQYVDFVIDNRSSWIVKDDDVLYDSGRLQTLSYGILYLKHPNGNAILTIDPQFITLFYHFEKDGYRLQDFAYMGRKIWNKETGESYCYLNSEERNKLFRRKKFN